MVFRGEIGWNTTGCKFRTGRITRPSQRVNRKYRLEQVLRINRIKDMKIIALLISALMVLVGLTVVFWPEGLMELARYAHTSSGLYVAAFGRIALGALLFMAAAATRTPRTVRVIGPLIFVAGLATALISV